MPLQFDLEIAGVPKLLKAGSLSITRPMNGRATASFQIVSPDRSYRPALNATVEISVESVVIFGGLITVPAERGLAGGVKRPITTHVTAADYHVFADRRFVNETVPAGTLKAALQVVLTYLTGYGVTLDVGQVDGPALPELIFNYMRASDVLGQLMSLTAQFGDQFVWEIDATKVLRAYQPSTVPAPFDLIAVSNLVPEVVGDIEVEQNLENYANRIIVKVAPVTEVGHVEAFTGDDVTTVYNLTFTLTAGRGIIHLYLLDGVTPAGGETFGMPGDTPIQWQYDPSTNTITRLIGPTSSTRIYSLTFDGTFEAVGEAEDTAGITAFGLIEKVIQVEEVPAGATAQSLAEGYLAQSLPIHHTIRYRTLAHGLAPGQIQTITVPARDLTGAAILTSVNLREFGPARVEYQIEATLADDTNILKAFQDLYKVWRGDLTGKGGTGTSTVGAGGPATIGPAPPFRSNQYNDEGAFGGNIAWLFYKESTTVTLGTDHTPGGANNLLVGRGHTVL